MSQEAASTQRDDSDQVLQAVKFTDKKVLGLHLDLDEEFQAAGCFYEVIRGYQIGVVESDVMRGLQLAIRLDVIIPSPTGLTPGGKVEAEMNRLCSLIEKSTRKVYEQSSTSYRPWSAQ